MKSIRYVDASVACRDHSWGEYQRMFRKIVSEKVDARAIGCFGGGTMTWNYVDGTFHITPEFCHQTDIRFDFNTNEVVIDVR